MRFKIGDKVKYISGIQGDNDFNPLWGGKFGRVKGVITNANNGSSYCSVSVKWSNGNKNVYYESDLEIIGKRTKLIKEVYAI